MSGLTQNANDCKAGGIRVEILRSEIAYCQVAINDFSKTVDQVLGISSLLVSALVVGAAAATTPNTQNWLLGLLPLLLGILLAFAIRSTNTILSLGGYRKALEEEVAWNAHLGDSLWEHSGAGLLKRTISHASQNWLVFGFWVLTWLVGAYSLADLDLSTFLSVLWIAIYVVLMATFAVSALETNSMLDKVYERASAELVASRPDPEPEATGPKTGPSFLDYW